MTMDGNSYVDREIITVAEQLAGTAGIHGVPVLTPLQGGRNNQVFRMIIGNVSFLLKAYFRHEKDPRDRLGTEYAFLSFVWSRGMRMIPRPIAADPVRSLGLYEFINGEKLSAGDIREEHIRQSLDFYFALNAAPDNPAARNLPNASEACFSICDHLSLVDRRLRRLLAIEPGNGFEAVHQFIHEELFKTWKDMKRNIMERAAEWGVDVDQRLSDEKRVLSPSDFGFHNAIIEPGGRLRFLDFEYAGWDDPAKMVCDFCCQPEVPIPPEYISFFQESVIAVSDEAEVLRKRIRFLLPVYRIKWCCIMLNDFLPVGNERRDFSNQRSQEKRRSAQLQKARRYFADWIEVDDKRNCPAEKS
jgi:hypothetical protein